MFHSTEAGQEIDLHPRIKCIADLTKFAEDRITILYSGVLAQNLKSNGLADQVAAEQSLTSTAKDDFSKIRELMRPAVGATYPDASYEEFTNYLEQTRLRLFNRATKIVEANAALIGDLTDFYLREAIKAQKSQKDRQVKKIDKALIDGFLQGKQLHCP